MSLRETRTPGSTLLWIWLQAWIAALGWWLSAAGMLNAWGYLFGLFAAFLITWWLWCGHQGKIDWGRYGWLRWRRRFTQPLPASFLAITLLELGGGLCQEPNNYDALSYRTPRSLHWLAAGQWHWIETIHNRLNARACGFELAATPLMAFTHTDRLFFLLSLGSFLLLPGLIFAWLRRMGVGGRGAWNWMWVFSSGYCFALQAGGIQNDLYGVVWVLAAVVFARRAVRGGAWLDLATSVLAAALSTNAKSSNLPLLLPWAIAIWPAIRGAFRRPLTTVVVAILAAFASLLPLVALNQHYCGDWTGARIEPLAKQISQRSYAPAYVVHNAALLMIQNFAPPIFPWTGSWNRVVQQVLPESWLKLLDAAAEEGRNSYRLHELPGDEHTGLGLGVSALVLVQVLARRKLPAGAPSQSFYFRLLRWSPWLSLLVYSATAAIMTTSRIAAPYYALLLPSLLPLDKACDITRRSWWPRAAAGVWVTTLVLVVLSPSRPLWPARWALDYLYKYFPEPMVDRARTVYQVYGDRANLLQSLVARLEHPTDTIGFLAPNGLETSVWKPFGIRRVVQLLPTDDAARVRARGAQVVIVSVPAVEETTGLKLEAWAAKIGAEKVALLDLRTTASREPTQWALLKLLPQPTARIKTE